MTTTGSEPRAMSGLIKVIFIISCIGFLLLVNLIAIEFIRNSVDFSPIEPNEKVKEKDKNDSIP